MGGTYIVETDWIILVRYPKRVANELRKTDDHPSMRSQGLQECENATCENVGPAPDIREKRAVNTISVVIPLWNEALSLRQLCQEIIHELAQLQRPFEIILVDDGSRDASWSEIVKLSSQHPEIRGICLRRNSGKADALRAGFDGSHGNTIVTLDADLQDDPTDIPRLIAMLDAGWDLVSGWKQTRKDPWSRRFASRLFNALVNLTTGMRLNDHNCGLKCYRQEVVRELSLYGELHRFIPVMAAAQGFRVTELPVNHRCRPYGRSKYGWRRIPRGLLDLLTVLFLTSFSRRPQHLLGGLGGCLLLVSGAITGYLAFEWCRTRMVPGLNVLHLHDRAMFYYSLVGMIIGVQLLSLGLLAELFAWIHHRQSVGYCVKEVVGHENRLAPPGSEP